MSNKPEQKFGDISDEQLVSLVKDGKYEYFALLRERYMPAILKSSAKYSHICSKADLDFEGVSALLSAIYSFDPEKALFKTYVGSAIEKAMCSLCRGARAQKNIPSELISSIEGVFAVDEHSPESVLIEREDANSFIERAKSLLSGLEYKVFCGLVSGKTYKEIASQVGINEKAVDNALKRVRNKLKR